MHADSRTRVPLGRFGTAPPQLQRRFVARLISMHVNVRSLAASQLSRTGSKLHPIQGLPCAAEKQAALFSHPQQFQVRLLVAYLMLRARGLSQPKV